MSPLDQPFPGDTPGGDPPDYTLGIQIRRDLVSAIRASTFPRIIQDQEGLPSIGDSLAPASVLVNEVSGDYELDTRDGSSLSMRRRSWVFKAIVSFGADVTSEIFERSFAEKPLYVENEGYGAVRLALISQSADRPPTYGSGSGTEFEFTFGMVLYRPR